jgi:antitoxin ParD1/3/4
MQIVLPPEVEALVQRQVASGKYQDAVEVIVAGVELLQQQENLHQRRLQQLRQEAQLRWRAAQRGAVANRSTENSL